MQKKYHFIAGLPRSGSTLLTGILRQNPRFHSDITDMLHRFCFHVGNALNNNPDFGARITATPNRVKNVYMGVIDGWYKNINKEVIFNTHRYWLRIPEYLYSLNNDFKVICCVRDINLILNSFEKNYKSRSIHDPIVTTLYHPDHIDTVWARTNCMANLDTFFTYSYNLLKEAYYGQYRKHLLLVEYDDLTKTPRETMNKIYGFIGEKYYEHDFNNVVYTNVAYDEDIQSANLHTIHGRVIYKDPQIVLPPDLMEKYSGWEFWRG